MEPIPLIGLPLGHDQSMAYVTRPTLRPASASYQGESKTDTKDVSVIVGQARVRRDLGRLQPGDEITVALRTRTGRRTDPTRDRTRQINRPRSQPLEKSAALEREPELVNELPIALLTVHQTAAAIRRGEPTRSAMPRILRSRSHVSMCSYLSALPSLKSCPGPKSHYARKRAEGKG
ncbi:transposase [Streptomyces sp. SID8352]|uniref:IS110 family transposase n=1 Tax=Streptomyces sp. SID8352 TaxID=2690338 RepID=UPI0031F67544